jgi:hypothetical protein
MHNALADPYKRAATNCAADAIIAAKTRRFKPLERESQGRLYETGSGLSQDHQRSAEWMLTFVSMTIQGNNVRRCPHSKGPEDCSPGPLWL